MAEKLNCWQVTKCGREPGGAKAETEGICPTATDLKYNNVNGGKGCGRFCWTVQDSACHEIYGRKFVRCISCSFFGRVQEEEGRGFVMTRSAFIGKNIPESDTLGQCKFINECGFFKKYNGTVADKDHGWIKLFCNHQNSSQHCERKIQRKKTGEIPPDNLTPTGILLEAEEELQSFLSMR